MLVLFNSVSSPCIPEIYSDYLILRSKLNRFDLDYVLNTTHERDNIRIQSVLCNGSFSKTYRR